VAQSQIVFRGQWGRVAFKPHEIYAIQMGLYGRNARHLFGMTLWRQMILRKWVFK
jgi:hypothetical protein